MQRSSPPAAILQSNGRAHQDHPIELVAQIPARETSLIHKGMAKPPGRTSGVAAIPLAALWALFRHTGL
jgi:hypothetical protein